jgi:hypothetical protein
MKRRDEHGKHGKAGKKGGVGKNRERLGWFKRGKDRLGYQKEDD